MYNKVAVYGSRRQSPYLEGLRRLFLFLEERGFRVFVHDRFEAYLKGEGVDTGTSVSVENIPEGVSLVISIGGDGTFLRAARWVGDRQIPILGVNTGHLGYLAACGMEGFEETFAEILRGEVDVEKRMLLKVECDALNPGTWRYSLNEVTARRDESASVISIRTSLGGIPLADYVADGLIISTPTGSTAYNLSSGGPILEPTVGCFAITPIAPHTLTLRPLVVADSSEIEMEVESRSGKFRLSLDDRAFTLYSGEKILVRKAPFGVFIIRRKNSNFAKKLREKLFWNS